jgi:hypothetical protein
VVSQRIRGCRHASLRCRSLDFGHVSSGLVRSGLHRLRTSGEPSWRSQKRSSLAAQTSHHTWCGASASPDGAFRSEASSAATGMRSRARSSRVQCLPCHVDRKPQDQVFGSVDPNALRNLHGGVALQQDPTPPWRGYRRPREPQTAVLQDMPLPPVDSVRRRTQVTGLRCIVVPCAFLSPFDSLQDQTASNGQVAEQVRRRHGDMNDTRAQQTWQ